ncbi:probable protein phosphatase 2C 24 isoform X2 [Prosopis cineraria]|uniref:probable protein phosphatase 2C 24 isoform X2 n=1 Tax=Prosopis cineraria TaxID=364024 RepID=UPI00240F230B|nr:probable protein phosphatase 2C 24 isoform X2 [Prosopis cineraria]
MPRTTVPLISRKPSCFYPPTDKLRETPSTRRILQLWLVAARNLGLRRCVEGEETWRMPWLSVPGFPGTINPLVAAKCKDRLHELVKEELEKQDWPTAMEQSLSRMDQEVIAWNANVLEADCRCELQSPECDAVGSTAVIAVLTADKVIVANCGDSRAVLCRGGKPIPLSSDHKPDRPDELNRIHEAGGRVIYWDGPRVQGMLAMSRAIGDNYLKPYVSCVPEVTITDRTAEDDCLILATDGLWDVVSNETACGVARTCLRGSNHSPPNPGAALEGEIEGAATEMSDKACSDASMLLTKLALARHSTDNVSVVVVDLRRGA